MHTPVTMTTAIPISSSTCVCYRQSSQFHNDVSHDAAASGAPGLASASPRHCRVMTRVPRESRVGGRGRQANFSDADLAKEGADELSIPPKLEELVLAFQAHDDLRARYQHLLQYAYALDPLQPEQCVRENQMKGCALQVWVACRLGEDGRVHFQANSPSLLMKGLAAVLVEGLSGATPREVMNVPVEFVRRLGLQQSLTPSRNNGFLNLLKLMKKKTVEACGESNMDPK